MNWNSQSTLLIVILVNFNPHRLLDTSISNFHIWWSNILLTNYLIWKSSNLLSSCLMWKYNICNWFDETIVTLTTAWYDETTFCLCTSKSPPSLNLLLLAIITFNLNKKTTIILLIANYNKLNHKDQPKKKSLAASAFFTSPPP